MIQLRPFKLLPLVAALAAACSKTPEPSATSAPAPEQPASASTPAPERPAPGADLGAPGAAALHSGAELIWDAPSSWESVRNPSPIRKATYKIKRADGDAEDAELSVSQAGGTVDANIDRWIGQFPTKAEGYPKRNQHTVNDLKVTVVEIRGTFTGSGMPGMPASKPKESSALLGAVAEAPEGGLWFFKMTGPEKTVVAARSDFDKLVNSFRLK
jgi:hypothetical protein